MNQHLLNWANLSGLILLRYLVLAGTAYLLFYGVLSRRWLPRKIQARFPARADYQREIAYSVLSSVIFAVIGLVVLASPATVYFRVYAHLSSYPVWYTILSFGLMLVTHETYFYWTHRLLHHPRLFRLVHRVHHQSTNPSPWAAQAFHPLEALVEGGVVVVFALLFPVHPTVVALFMLFSFMYNVYGHLGFEVIPDWVSRGWLGNWLNTATHHNLHHSRVRGNYGLYFTVWDRLMHTLVTQKPTPVVPQKASILAVLLLGSLCFSVGPREARPFVARPLVARPLVQPAIAGDWYIDQQEAIVSIYQLADGTLNGRIIWAKDPADNQRLQQQSTPVLVLKRFRPEADGSWQHGTVNPPKIPVSLHGHLMLVDHNTLKISVWKLWFSQTLTWTRK